MMKFQCFYENKELSAQTGLDEEQVLLLRRKYGRNEMTPPQKTPWWKELLEKFEDPTIVILLVAALLALGIAGVEKWVLNNPEASFLDSIGIFLAIGLATLVGFFSERKSAKEFELLNRVKEDVVVKTLRDGQMTEVHIGDLVVGDVLKLAIGDKVPADGVLFETANLMVEQSMLTGESFPVRKTPYVPKSATERTDLGDEGALATLNRLENPFFVAGGSMIADGSGWMRVTAVGDRTQMGKIASALKEETGGNETPLTQKLTRLAKTVSGFGVAGAMLIFTVMSVKAVLASPLLNEIELSHRCWLGLGSVILGALVVRFLLRPFFRSMDLDLKSGFLRFLCLVPMSVVMFTLLLGTYGVASASPTDVLFRDGLELLHATLLSFVVAVTVIVVAVPEGLPMMVTVSLALNMMKMARENCLVRKLIASETIGSATVVCTDKTGTLTQNKMTPIWGILGKKAYPTIREMETLPRDANWEAIVAGIAVNSAADLHEEETSDGTRRLHGIGNPTECAFLKFLDLRGISYAEIRKGWRVQNELGHNSQRKMSAVTAEKDGKCVTFVKGAPERIFVRCSQILIDGKAEPIADYLEFLERETANAEARGLRILAFCELEGDQASDETLEQMERDPRGILTGVLGIADPVREEVAASVANCRKAGIMVKMVTGDSLPTARAIAQETGIYSGAEDELVMTSAEFNEIPDDALPEKALKLCVLARSTPADKLRLVKALRLNGEVVAMTGDGVNDAPALKFADVGLSMGKSGTEVAKEASDIVLVDDNFKNIVTGVLWGRTLFQNIQRFLQFQLSVNVVALLCAVLGPCLGVPLPLTVTQLLWINIIMDTFAAVAYSTQPPRESALEQPPIPRDSSIISAEMLINILLVGVFQTVMLFVALFGGWFAAKSYDSTISILDKQGYLNANLESLTIFFTMLVMFQFWHKFNCRSLSGHESPFCGILKCRVFLAIILTITLTQIVMVQVPQVGVFFRTAPLSLVQWLEITAVTSSVLVVGWIARKFALLFQK